MNVLFVNSMRGMGGGERWVLEAAEGLAGRGHQVSVAGRSRGSLVAEARRRGVDALAIPMSGDADLFSVVAMASWIGRRGVDVVSVNIERAVRLGAAASALAGRPAVVERRGLELSVVPSALDRLIYGRYVDHIIANAEAIRARIVEAGLVPPEKVSVIPNGIDPSRVQGGDGGAFRDRLGVDREAPLVLFMGRLVSDKRPLDALEAFGTVAREIPGAVMAFVGDGSMLESVRFRARDLGTGRVVFAGRIEDVASALDAADVLLVTSRREGMPHVVLEAMASGTPVVATAVSGIPEIIDDGETGLLAAQGDVRELARLVRTVLTDVDLAAALAERARTVVGERHDLGRMLDAVEERFSREAERARGARS